MYRFGPYAKELNTRFLWYNFIHWCDIVPVGIPGNAQIDRDTFLASIGGGEL